MVMNDRTTPRRPDFYNHLTPRGITGRSEGLEPDVRPPIENFLRDGFRRFSNQVKWLVFPIVLESEEMVQNSDRLPVPMFGLLCCQTVMDRSWYILPNLVYVNGLSHVGQITKILLL